MDIWNGVEARPVRETKRQNKPFSPSTVGLIHPSLALPRRVQDVHHSGVVVYGRVVAVGGLQRGVVFPDKATC